MTRRLLAALLAALFLLGVGASVARAHAQLEETVPASGSNLETSPEEILLRFSEPVEVSLGGIRLYDSDAQRLDSGDIVRPGGDGSLVALPLDPLPEGAYVVTWRVTSADSHPVSGAFTFQVGEAQLGADTDALAQELLAAEGGSEAAGALYATVRALVFVGLAGFAGVVAFICFVWRPSFADPTTRRLLWGSWAVLTASTALSIGLQGVTAAALPLRDLVNPDVISAVVDTRFGQMAVVRLVLLALCVPLLLALRGRERPAPWWAPAATLGSVGLFVTVALAGHAASGRFVPLAIGLDLAHLAAMSVWLGGLVVLLGVVLPRRDLPELEEVVPRFSQVAFGAVVVLVATGVVQSWRQVGSLEALGSTTYGRVLLVKVALVAGMVAVAAFSRAVVQSGLRMPEPVPAGPGAMRAEERDEEVEVRRLERSVMIEVMIAAAVLVATALLVNIQPAIDAVEQPWNASLDAEGYTVDVVVEPASQGPVTVHIYAFDPDGAPAEVLEVFADLTLPAEDIGPFEIPLVPAGTGHFTTFGFDVPLSGEWDLDLRLRVDEFEVVRADTSLRIR